MQRGDRIAAQLLLDARADINGKDLVCRLLSAVASETVPFIHHSFVHSRNESSLPALFSLSIYPSIHLVQSGSTALHHAAALEQSRGHLHHLSTWLLEAN